MLVGREDALAELWSALQQASAGKPRVLVVRGDAGIGKSHLLRELCARATFARVVTCIGHGHEDMDVAYLAVRDALLRAHHALGDLPAFGRVLELLSEAPQPAAAAREDHSVELCEAVLELARQRPLLLAFEDLHWLDAMSLRLLLQLGFTLGETAQRSDLPPPRLLLVLTTRAPQDGSEQARALARLLREPSCSVVELQGLDLLDTVALVRTMGFGRPTQSAAQALHATTLGNPLFIKGLLQRARSNGASELPERLDPAAEPLPKDLLSVVSAWLDAAPRDVLPWLRRAALLGPRFSLQLLASVVGHDQEQLADALAAVPELVQLDGDHGALAHPLLRHALLERLPAQTRAQLHAQIADCLVRTSPNAIDAGDLTLAHHLLLAGDAAPAALRLRVLTEAAERLTALCALGEAAAMHLARSALCETPRARADALYLAGRCQQRNYEAAACVRSFAAAEKLYRECGEPERAARAHADRARTELYNTPLGQQRDMSDVAHELTTLPEDADEARGWILLSLSDAGFYGRRPQEGIDFAQQALARAERVRDHQLFAYGSVSLAIARAQVMDYELAARAYEAALAHVEHTGQPRLSIVPRIRRAAILHTVGALSEAEAEHRRASEDAARAADHGEHAFALANLIGIEASQGRFARAESHAHDMVRLLGRVDGRPWAPLFGLPALAYARHAVGRADDALSALQALREPGRFSNTVGAAEHVLGNTLSDLIALDADLPALEAARHERRARVARYAERIGARTADGSGLSVVCALLELCTAHGLHEAGAGPRAALERAQQQGAMFTAGWPFSIARVLGNAALARGEQTLSCSLLERAVRLTEERGLHAELARCRLDLARALLAAASPDAEREARAHVAQAVDASAGLGMVPLLRQASALALALGMPQPSSAKQPDVTNYELRLLQQLGSGEPAARIAERHLLNEQGLRERTAGLLQRLGAARPLDATPYGVEHGFITAPPATPGLTLSLMVTDLVGFTPMVERLGDGAAQQVIREHNRLLRAALADHGGMEITHTGDGVIAAFRSGPEAAGCALAIQRALATRNASPNVVPLTVRIGLHAGDALPEEGRLFGAAVIIAVRICSACEGGHILASELVQFSCHGLQSRFVSRGPHALKGFSAPLQLFELATQDSQDDATDSAAPRITP